MTSDFDIPPESDRIEALLLECLDRIEREGVSALDAFCREHPNESRTLRRRVALLHAAGFLEPTPADPNAFPERLGEFRLIERLGGGGMGVVYRAEQEPLAREVALKVIRNDYLHFPGARERFQREMNAVARLAHPGVVPIYTVGEQEGVPFFAMERVLGCTLAQALRSLEGAELTSLAGADLARSVRASPASAADVGEDQIGLVFEGSWAESCARITLRVAEALQHVHDRGILHRDVKPSNIMITPTGRVMLFDFGLASAKGDVRLTQSGSPLGSLPYMAPEQHAGEDVDVRADVFSLGATLYELLCGRLPFPIASAGTGTSMIPDYAPPTALRRTNSQVSWELETVCLTALDPDPARRYASARAMARDLTNVLEHRPITARRPGPWLRARRWMQRHPTVAAGVSLTLFLLTVGAFVYAGQQRDARERVDRQRREAIRAVESMLTRVGRETLVSVPYMEDVRRELLEDALGFYQGFLAEVPDDQELIADTSHAWRQVGEIQRQLGNVSESDVALARAIEILERLDVTDPEVASSLAAALNERALVHTRSVRRTEEARALFARSIALKAELVDRFPDDAGHRKSLANGYSNLGSWLAEAGRLEEAVEPVSNAVAILDRLLEDGEDGLDVQEKAGLAHANLGAVSQNLGNFSDAKRNMTRALELQERLVERRDRPDDRSRLARTLTNLQQMTRVEGRIADASVLGERARTIWEELASDFPRIPEYRLSLARALQTVSKDFATAGDLNGAEGPMRRAYQEVDRLCREHPDQLSYRSRRAELGIAMTRILFSAGRKDESTEAIERAVATLTELHELRPGKYGIQLLDATNLRGVMRQLDERLDEAMSDFRAAIVLCEERIAEDEEDVAAKSQLAQLCHNVAYQLDSTDDAEALAIAERGLGVARELVDHDPADLVFRKQLADLHTTVGGIHRDLKDHDRAEEQYRAAVALREELYVARPNDPDAIGDFGGAKSNLGRVLRDRGDREAAIVLLREAAALERSVLARVPDHVFFRSYLGNQLETLGELLIDVGRIEEAREVAEELSAFEGFEERGRQLVKAIESVGAP